MGILDGAKERLFKQKQKQAQAVKYAGDLKCDKMKTEDDFKAYVKYVGRNGSTFSEVMGKKEKSVSKDFSLELYKRLTVLANSLNGILDPTAYKAVYDYCKGAPAEIKKLQRRIKIRDAMVETKTVTDALSALGDKIKAVHEKVGMKEIAKAQSEVHSKLK